MTIPLGQPRQPGAPVIKATAIGQAFVGALVDLAQRDVLKDGQPQINANGKPRQELVLTLVAMPATTAPAGIGGDVGTPHPGDVVRLILHGGGFASWIEATRGKPINVGDVVSRVIEHAQAYSASGTPQGGRITDQAQANALPRTTSVGFYGPIAHRAPTPAEAVWVQAAEAAHLERQQRTPLVSVPAAAAGDDEEAPW